MTVIFEPTREEVLKSPMTAFITYAARAVGREFPTHGSFHRFSVDEPDRFWGLLLDWLDLDVEGERTPVVDGSDCESARFFPNLRLSFARNLLRAAATGDDELPAIVSVSEAGVSQRCSRRELARSVLAVASALGARGVGSGDRVVAIACNTAETVVACLASLAVGASWSSVAPNLGPDATLDRFGQIAPKVLFCHSSFDYQGVHQSVAERVSEVVRALPSVALIVTLDDGAPAPELGERAVALGALREEGASGIYRGLEDLPVFPFDHPTYVLFSSGTTGRPKCIVHGAGGTLLEHAKEHRLHSNLAPGEKMLFATAAGWMMWNWLVSALASRVTIVLYEGSVTHPRPDALWRLVAREQVHVFGTSPGYLQYCRDGGIETRELDLGALRAVLSTGSVLADELFLWVAEHVKRVPLQSISGGTDIIGCFLLGNPNAPVRAGELQSPSLGYDVDAVGPDGKPVPPGTVGELVCRRPFPSRPLGLLGDDSGERFHATYFSQNPGVWTHGDLLELTSDGGARVHGRSDGVLNVRGIRIGPAEIYRALSAGVPEILEAMAVEQAAPSEIGGSRLVLLVVLREGRVLTNALTEIIRSELSSRCSPAHVPAVILARDDLPTTHSGKRSERAARDAVNRRPVANIGALRNPECLAGLDGAPELCIEEPSLLATAGPSHEVPVEDICSIWRDVLGIGEVAPGDSFFQVGGQSLAAVALLSRIERAYGVRLPMSALLAKASTPARMAAFLSAEAEHQDTHLVSIRPEGSCVPVFWLPGGGGLSVLAFREISLRLGESQPVYGFEAKLSLDDAPDSIGEIARRYVEDLVEAFPEGPYLLLGFSFGSWVAFEMGVELRRRGKSVPLLCVFDSPLSVRRSLVDRSRILARRALYKTRGLAGISFEQVPRYLHDTASIGVRRSRERLARLGLAVDPRQVEEATGNSVFDALDRKNREAAMKYVRGTIPAFDGRLTAILAERTSQAAVDPELDDRLAIGRYASGGLEVHRVASSHLAMLEPPDVDDVAVILRDCITRATSAVGG